MGFCTGLVPLHLPQGSPFQNYQSQYQNWFYTISTQSDIEAPLKQPKQLSFFTSISTSISISMSPFKGPCNIRSMSFECARDVRYAPRDLGPGLGHLTPRSPTMKVWVWVAEEELVFISYQNGERERDIYIYTYI